MRRWAPTVGIISLFAVAAVFAVDRGCREPVPPPPHHAPERDAEPATAADVGHGDAQTVEAWRVVEPEEGAFVALVDGTPVETDFTIGAAGIYPPLRTRGVGIAIPTPNPTMSGEALDTLEVYARSVEGGHAYWGEVSVDANAVELTPASRVQVRVVNEAQRPLPGVALRLGREVVGLVMLNATTGESGEATFEALPAGDYVVTGEVASGRLSPTEVTAGESVVLTALRGREVLGVVRDPDGNPIAGATVAIHGAGVDANPLEDVPADVLTTNLLGEFRTTGVPGVQFTAVALADGWAPTQTTSVAPDGDLAARLDLTMRRGNIVRARVVDEGGHPVAHAKVEWRDGAMGATVLADADGVARLSGVPRSATVSATLDRFDSPEIALQSLPAANAFDVELRLTNADGRIWRVRVRGPKDAVLRDLEVYDSNGARCSVTTTDGRDFTLRGCGDGTAMFNARTDRGIARWDAGPFVDGTDVVVPAPIPVRVTVRGRDDEAWASTTFTLTGGSALESVPLEVSRQPFGSRVVTAVYRGDWELRVFNSRIGEVPFAVDVKDVPVEMSIELVALQTFRAKVVDAYGAPVTGAYAMLFSNDRLVDASRSAGQLPIEFRVRPPFDGEILVVDPKRGEARARVSTSADSNPEVIQLRDRVLTLPVPSTRPTPESLEARIGGSLVERDRGLIIDFVGESVGTRAGLRRGDLLVSAWPDGTKLRVVVYRKGDGYIDVVVP